MVLAEGEALLAVDTGHRQGGLVPSTWPWHTGCLLVTVSEGPGFPVLHVSVCQCFTHWMVKKKKKKPHCRHLPETDVSALYR